ncbi:MAG: tRNA (adenosine(37)-N6)-threonylcarbamoyltransferase complex ATPase subunit type 1 TsaE [Candidatus Muiribacteriota bacterium]|jgi:tRNA threonylcarbamoyladenosine biosynthesis protein TsaE
MQYTKKQAENAIYENFLKNSQNCRIFLFTGDLGAGKTYYISHILNKKFNIDEVTSPTYTIINTYIKNNNTIHHADLYRLEEEIELFETGFCDIIEEKTYMFVEWPEKFIDFFSSFNYVLYEIKEINQKQEREIKIYEHFIH